MPYDLISAIQALEDERAEEAVVILENLRDIEDTEDNPDILVYLGMAYVQVEKPDLAIDVLRQAENLVEEHSVVALFLGRALKASGFLDEAETELRRSIDLDPDESAAWDDLGNVLFLKGQFGHAVEVLNKAVELFPESAATRSLLAVCLMRLGDYTAALRHWYLVHIQQSTSLMVVTNIAFIHLMRGELRKAAPFVNQLIELNPDDRRTRTLFGDLKFQSGMIDDAIDAFNSSLVVDPKNLPALAYLAIIGYQMGRGDVYSRYMQEIENITDPRCQRWRSLCYVYQMLGLEEELIDCLIQGTQEYPNDAAPWVALAKAYEKKGMSVEAEVAWRKTFELRRYIKMKCPNCGGETRIPYMETSVVDIHEDRVCVGCEKTMEMPQSLAVF